MQRAEQEADALEKSLIFVFIQSRTSAHKPYTDIADIHHPLYMPSLTLSDSGCLTANRGSEGRSKGTSSGSHIIQNRKSAQEMSPLGHVLWKPEYWCIT